MEHRTTLLAALAALGVLLALAPTASAQAVEGQAPLLVLDAGLGLLDAPAFALDAPEPRAASTRANRRARRLEITGWTLAGVSTVGALATGLAVARTDCDDEWICFNGPGFGAIVGATLFAAPFAVGALVGSIGTVRRRRAQRAGTWDLALVGSGARFELTF